MYFCMAKIRTHTRVLSSRRGGAIVETHGLRAFLPGSHMIGMSCILVFYLTLSIAVATIDNHLTLLV